MKKTNKVNPLEFFRKSAEARQKAFKTGGVNVPRQSLTKKYNGGSGMGDMYAADQAYDSMTDTPTPVAPTTPMMIRPSMRPMFSNPDNQGDEGYRTNSMGKNGGMMKKGGATKAKKNARKKK
jgi:hypothetical protein